MQEYLKAQYVLRLNQLNHTWEYQMRGDANAAFKPLNEHSLYVELDAAGLHIAMTQLTTLLQADWVPRYDPIEAYFTALPPFNPALEPDYIALLAQHVQTTDPGR